ASTSRSRSSPRVNLGCGSRGAPVLTGRGRLAIFPAMSGIGLTVATPFTPDDLARIEERMRDIVRRDEPITREVWDRDKAVAFFDGLGERYKAEYIGEIPREEEISLYRQGNFVDLCVGPHLPSTGRLGQAF